jgi:hypothetical protein
VVDVLAGHEVTGEPAPGAGRDVPEPEQRAGQHGEMAAGADHPVLGLAGGIERGRVQRSEHADQRRGRAQVAFLIALLGQTRAARFRELDDQAWASAQISAGAAGTSASSGRCSSATAVSTPGWR